MQIARVVLINYGPEQDRLAIIVNVVKQQIPFTRLLLTKFVFNVHRNKKTKKVQEEFDKEKILKRWNESTNG